MGVRAGGQPGSHGRFPCREQGPAAGAGDEEGLRVLGRPHVIDHQQRARPAQGGPQAVAARRDGVLAEQIHAQYTPPCLQQGTRAGDRPKSRPQQAVGKRTGLAQRAGHLRRHRGLPDAADAVDGQGRYVGAGRRGHVQSGDEGVDAPLTADHPLRWRGGKVRGPRGWAQDLGRGPLSDHPAQARPFPAPAPGCVLPQCQEFVDGQAQCVCQCCHGLRRRHRPTRPERLRHRCAPQTRSDSQRRLVQPQLDPARFESPAQLGECRIVTISLVVHVLAPGPRCVRRCSSSSR
ncbi:hypothetical protein RKD46_000042 [Streptomyces pseudovenezuelae]